MSKQIIFSTVKFSQNREDIETYDLGYPINGYPIGIFNLETNEFIVINILHTTKQAIEEFLIKEFDCLPHLIKWRT